MSPESLLCEESFDHANQKAHAKYGSKKSRFQKTAYPHGGKKDDDSFDPTIRLLLRIMRGILENDSIGRTALTLKANVNYTILAKHLDWLEQRGMVEFFIEDGKVNVRLSTLGTEFVFRLCGLMDDISD